MGIERRYTHNHPNLHDSPKEFQFDWEEVITDDLPLHALRLKENKIDQWFSGHEPILDHLVTILINEIFNNFIFNH